MCKNIPTNNTIIISSALDITSFIYFKLEIISHFNNSHIDNQPKKTRDAPIIASKTPIERFKSIGSFRIIAAKRNMKIVFV